MSLLSRYILRAHIGPFLFGTCTVMFLFLLQFLMRYIDQLVGKGLGTWVILQLIVLNLAWMITLSVPMGVLVSTLMGFGSLSGSNEVTIIKSSGAGLFRMMRPVILTAALIFGLLFWFNDYVLPDANHRAKILMRDIKSKKPAFAIEKGQFSTQVEGYSILARDMDSTNNMMLGVTIYDNTDISRTNVVSADSGLVAFSPDLSKLIVTLYQGEVHQINQKDYGDYRKIDFSLHRIIMDAKGFAFSQSEEGLVSRGDRELSIADMEQRVSQKLEKVQKYSKNIAEKIDKHRYYLFSIADTTIPDTIVPVQRQPAVTRADAAKRVENRLRLFGSRIGTDISSRNNERLNAQRYLVEIHKKYAIPAACLVFVFVGCPLGIITRRGNFGIGAAISLGFYVVYWSCLIGGEKLADRGFLPPWFGMWLANIVIGITGIILTMKNANENIDIRRFFRFLFGSGKRG